MLEDIIVALLVASSAIFSAWRLMSARWRLRLLDAAQPLTGLPALGILADRLLTRLRSRTLAQLSGGCGTCSHNKAAPKSFSGR